MGPSACALNILCMCKTVELPTAQLHTANWSRRAILPPKRVGLRAKDCALEVSREGIREARERSGWSPI